MLPILLNTRSKLVNHVQILTQIPQIKSSFSFFPKIPFHQSFIDNMKLEKCHHSLLGQTQQIF